MCMCVCVSMYVYKYSCKKLAGIDWDCIASLEHIGENHLSSLEYSNPRKQYISVYYSIYSVFFHFSPQWSFHCIGLACCLSDLSLGISLFHIFKWYCKWCYILDSVFHYLLLVYSNIIWFFQCLIYWKITELIC